MGTAIYSDREFAAFSASAFLSVISMLYELRPGSVFLFDMVYFLVLASVDNGLFGLLVNGKGRRVAACRTAGHPAISSSMADGVVALVKLSLAS